ncbi:MAG: hypothetical protein Q4G07_05865 [Oscillospiraceae bacterium]|nr:hypothetical protein [Oscillospiraceae bacterium]
MFKTIVKVAIGLLAGAGVLALGSKLVNKYYASLAEEDAEFDMDEYEDGTAEKDVSEKDPVEEGQDEDEDVF